MQPESFTRMLSQLLAAMHELKRTVGALEWKICKHLNCCYKQYCSQDTSLFLPQMHYYKLD